MTWQSILFSSRARIIYIYLYILCMYNIYMHTHNTRTPCPVLGGSPFLFCLVLLSSAQWSHALQFSWRCSMSHHRGSAIYIIMKVRTAAQRATHDQQKKFHVCAAQKKRKSQQSTWQRKKCMTRNKQVASSSLHTTRPPRRKHILCNKRKVAEETSAWLPHSAEPPK